MYIRLALEPVIVIMAIGFIIKVNFIDLSSYLFQFVYIGSERVPVPWEKDIYAEHGKNI